MPILSGFHVPTAGRTLDVWTQVRWLFYIKVYAAPRTDLDAVYQEVVLTKAVGIGPPKGYFAS